MTNSIVVQLDLAVINMDAMVNFYENVLGINFDKIDMNGVILYSGKMGETALNLVPNEIVGVEAQKSRHQLEVLVTDLKDALARTVEFKGTIGEEYPGGKQALVYDPDDNNLVLIQNK